MASRRMCLVIPRRATSYGSAQVAEVAEPLLDLALLFVGHGRNVGLERDKPPAARRGCSSRQHYTVGDVPCPAAAGEDDAAEGLGA